jgi:hypothetical protein
VGESNFAPDEKEQATIEAVKAGLRKLFEEFKALQPFFFKFKLPKKRNFL